MSTDLVRLDAFTQALVEAKTIPDVKNLLDQSDLFRQWLKKQKAGWDALNAGLEMKLRAERKLGDMINHDPNIHKGDPLKYHRDTLLSDYRITKLQSSRWQRLFDIPEENLTRYIAECGEHEELSTAGFLRFHLQILRQGVELPPLPKDLFTVIYADPPWDYEHFVDSKRSIIDNYDTMTTEQLCNLPIPKDADAILFLWSTNPKLQEALEIVHTWGFLYRTNMAWVKDKIGMGYYVRNQHELLLIARRGKLPPPDESLRVSSVINSPRNDHSRKPVEVYSLIEKMYPNQKYIELFATQQRTGWISWGHEVS